MNNERQTWFCGRIILFTVLIAFMLVIGPAKPTPVVQAQKGEEIWCEPVPEGDYSVAALTYEDYEEGFVFCSGALIAPSVVITARHCTYSLLVGPLDPAKIQVHLGEQTLGVTEISRHSEKDLALFRLDSTAQENPISLANYPFADCPYRPAKIIFWRKEQLFQSDFLVLSPQDCEAHYYLEMRFSDGTGRICLGRAFQELEKGHSGSPIFAPSPYGRWVLIGVLTDRLKGQPHVPVLGEGITDPETLDWIYSHF